MSVGGTHESTFITKGWWETKIRVVGPSQRCPLHLHLPLCLSPSTPHSLNPPNRHSKWLSWSKFITATSADNQMLSLDSHCLSLWPLRVGRREGRGGGEGVIGGKAGLRGGEAGVANLTVPDRWALSPPPRAPPHYTTRAPSLFPLIAVFTAAFSVLHELFPSLLV